MAEPFIASPHWSDAATVTTGNEIATMPAANLKDMQQSKKWRSSGLSNLWAQFDLTAARAIQCIALGSHNGSASGTIRVRAKAASDVTVSPAYDSGSVNLFPGGVKPSDWLRTRYDWFLLPASAQTYRYWRVDVTDGSNADGYFEAGRLMFGPAYELRPEYGLSKGFDAADQVEVTPFGGVLTEPRARPRTMQLVAQAVTQSAAEDLHELDRIVGLAGDVFVSIDPDGTTFLHRDSMFATVRTITDVARPDFGIWNKRYELREVL